jgi:hypothetical protein
MTTDKRTFTITHKYEIGFGAALIGAALRGENLREADLRRANLRDADLREADLRDADLSESALRGADLRGADLRGADLSGADLSGADFTLADLRGAKMHNTNVSGTNFTDSKNGPEQGHKATRPTVNDFMRYENGGMSEDEQVSFIQALIDTGMAWSLQGSYGRIAEQMIGSGKCDRPQ